MFRRLAELKIAFCCFSSFLSLLALARFAQAETLNVVSPSNFTITVGIGGFQDDEGNSQNPVTGDNYVPGDINPDTGNPVMFVSIGDSVGQGNPIVPPALLGAGVVPGTSDGSNANLNGSVSVSPGGFSINSGNLGLDVSGLWQPSNGTDALGAPLPAELGVFIDLGAAIPGQYVLAYLNGLNLSLNTSGPLTLGPGGTFDDPNGTLTLNSATISGFTAGFLSSAINSTVTNESTTTHLSGTYDGTTLTLPVSATIYADLSSVLPGLWAQIDANGTVVAQLVPEPGSVTLLGLALIGLVGYGYRRRRS